MKLELEKSTVRAKAHDSMERNPFILAFKGNAILAKRIYALTIVNKVLAGIKNISFQPSITDLPSMISALVP